MPAKAIIYSALQPPEFRRPAAPLLHPHRLHHPVAVGDPSAIPAVVCGAFGEGRYVACGIGMGIGGTGAEEMPPTKHEATLLMNAIHWLARA